MTTIGTFKAQGSEFTGEIATLTIRATNVRIAPVQRATHTGPSHRVYAGQAEVGAAWSRRSKEGRPNLSVLLDDPSLIAPVYASLLADEDGRSHNLLWSRGNRSKAD
ncbi:DUF736 domain-containing protein [Lichenifustis flavocetrariae]|uniref:DUF736 domain-containing protein n=1 Tax=Lichenifustis flavocetrariae TaxID=2949735 RepID=A0AA42CLW9_9HYPH|nr:DUF736 domain-containing protein [Lichenifustis flavocetrariae]MCW6512064.1 DUF736 domain-containing protein [Lichenifustis flavocetrariae]